MAYINRDDVLQILKESTYVIGAEKRIKQLPYWDITVPAPAELSKERPNVADWETRFRCIKRLR